MKVQRIQPDIDAFHYEKEKKYEFGRFSSGKIPEWVNLLFFSDDLIEISQELILIAEERGSSKWMKLTRGSWLVKDEKGQLKIYSDESFRKNFKIV